jgi:hypothetical protein
MATRNPVADGLEAQFREAEARMDVLVARARAEQAGEEMQEVSGLRAAREKARATLDAMKRDAAADFETSRRAVEQALAELDAGIDRAGARADAWDAARARRFDARLDEADARLRVWKAEAAQRKAALDVERRDALAALEQRAAEGRARAAEWREAAGAKAEAALAGAARTFDAAYADAARLFE